VTVDEVAGWAGPPLILFVGVSTSGSAAHAVFGRWSAELGQPWVLRGVDLPADAPPEAFARLVSAMRGRPAVRGALVTAHKLRLYRACGPDLARRAARGVNGHAGPGTDADLAAAAQADQRRGCAGVHSGAGEN